MPKKKSLIFETRKDPQPYKRGKTKYETTIELYKTKNAELLYRL